MPPSLSVGLTNAPAMEITPGGEVETTTAKLTVSTTSNSGYKVYLQTLDSSNAMAHQTKDGAEIKALASPTTLANFEENRWGFALGGEANYRGVPMESTVVKEASAAQTDTTYDLSFAARLDNSLPAGTYSNNVEVSVIANPQKLTGLLNLTYMQDMTSTICQATKGTDGSSSITPDMNQPNN